MWTFAYGLRTSRYITAWVALSGPQEFPMISPVRAMSRAKLSVSPGKAPRSLVTPRRSHSTACLGPYGGVVDQPTIEPSLLGAELIRSRCLPRERPGP